MWRCLHSWNLRKGLMLPHIVQRLACEAALKLARCNSPHLCVGFLFLILYPASSSPPPPPPPPPPFTHTWSHTPSSNHNFVTHHLSHTTSSHIIYHTQLCHTSSFTHNFVAHHLSHTTLSHILFHTQLSHTQSFMHTFVTQQLCHTSSFTHTFVTQQLCHISSFIHNVDQRHFAWQAWHLATSTLFLRGRRGTWRHPPSFCVAGVLQALVTHYLSHTPLSHNNFVTHHLSHTSLTSGTLRGRLGTWRHPPLFLRGRRGA